jgi:hypothetical protein
MSYIVPTAGCEALNGSLVLEVVFDTLQRPGKCVEEFVDCRGRDTRDKTPSALGMAPRGPLWPIQTSTQRTCLFISTAQDRPSSLSVKQ